MKISCLLGILVMQTHLITIAGNIPYSDPKDWVEWEKYRHTVKHPASLIQAEDLLRARQNVEKHEWARQTQQRVVRNATALAGRIDNEWCETMLEVTTAGCLGPCPACRDKGKRWHPNGQWSWSPKHSNQLTCKACKTVYPNDQYPETIKVTSTWDPRQTFTFIDGETFRCFSYKQARPSPAGIIRAKKNSYAFSCLETLAKAYALTGDPQFAHPAKRIFLRLADVFPTWLVRAGYGYNEYADCDPHTAARNILNLPNDELLCPPNKPDRKIHTGHWSASRFGTSGMDGWQTVKLALAYDLLCEARDQETPIFSDEERRRIERDVLLESTYLGACDSAINNKSVGNRAGAAIVGLVVGHPGLVRFGLDGFVRTVDSWFLPDGGTSESAAYAMMTMGGIYSFSIAFRDYSEPQGYRPPDGKRLVNFNASRDTRYGLCWQGLYWKLQGDLKFPPFADSYVTSTISATFAERNALAYPTPQLLAHLKCIAGEKPSSPDAIFYRDTEKLEGELPAFVFPDVVFPHLAQGHLRLGKNGETATTVLSASNWGGHHHYDSLNLYLWKDGHELLTDLGYLWDHPDKKMTYRSFAHNLVMVDGKRQERQRGGSFHLFGTFGDLKYMEASSTPYREIPEYRRTAIQIGDETSGSYLLDLFRVQGGNFTEYIFHGPQPTCETTGLTLNTNKEEKRLENPKSGSASSPSSIRWTFPDGYQFTAFLPENDREKITIGDGWGQRNHRNTDRGATFPYVLRRRDGGNEELYASVFEGAQPGEGIVRAIRVINNNTLAIDTRTGTDIVLVQKQNNPLLLKTPRIKTDARLAVVRFREDKAVAAYLVGGTHLESGNLKINPPASHYAGDILGNGGNATESWFEITTPANIPNRQTGQTLLVVGEDKIERAYPIFHTESRGKNLRIYTRHQGNGFPAAPAKTWKLFTACSWKQNRE